jgi:hypothetical protein
MDEARGLMPRARRDLAEETKRQNKDKFWDFQSILYIHKGVLLTLRVLSEFWEGLLTVGAFQCLWARPVSGTYCSKARLVSSSLPPLDQGVQA